MAEKVAELFGDEPKPQSEPTAAAPEPKAPEPSQAVTQPTVPTPEPPKPAEPKIEPGHVPLAAVLDEREKRKKAEERLAALEAQQRKPQAAPSVQDDPEGFAQYVQQVQERGAISSRFELSEVIATKDHGADVVKAAMDWGMERSQQSPAFAAEYLKQKHPIDWAVRQHKREKLVSEIGDDDAAQKAFIERRARELGLIPAAPPTGAPAPQAAPQPVAPSKPPPPSPSLASAPSAGSLNTALTPRNKDLERLGLND